MIIALLATSLTTCTSKNDDTASPLPPIISEGLPVVNELPKTSENTDMREGQPIPTNIIPESYHDYPMDVTFFTDTANIFARVPDITAAICNTSARMEFSSNRLEAVYTITDVDAAIAGIEDMLMKADFIKTDNINAQLDIDNPYSTPVQGDIIYLRTADGIFISLVNESGNLVVRYRQGNAYYVDGQPVTFETSSNDVSNYKGVLFNRTPFDYVAKRYGNDVPEPNNPLGTPAYICFIDSDNDSAGYVFRIDNPDARAESFKMTMEGAGFATESFTAEKSTYTKGYIKVSLEIVAETSFLSKATVTLETLSDSH